VTEFNALTRLLAVRMARYQMLFTADALQTLPRDDVVRLVTILVLELVRFARSVAVAAKWTQVFGEDFVFPRDLGRLRRWLRGLLLEIFRRPGGAFAQLFAAPLAVLQSDALYRAATMRVRPVCLPTS
jgi:hypothetical protein